VLVSLISCYAVVLLLSQEDLHTIEQVIAGLDKLEPLPATESKLIIEACESGRTNSLPPSEEILQKVCCRLTQSVVSVLGALSVVAQLLWATAYFSRVLILFS
jgi:hypothetical protein